MWSPKPSLIYSCQLLLILKHLAFVNDIKRLLSTVGKTTVQENIAHLWCWFLKASRRHFYKYLSWRYSAKNSGATMSTEGRFNSSLLKSSGCSWETKAGTHSSGEQWRWCTKAAQCTFPGQELTVPGLQQELKSQACGSRPPVAAWWWWVAR